MTPDNSHSDDVTRLMPIVKLVASMDAVISKPDAPVIKYAFDNWADDRVVFSIGSDRIITVKDLRAARSLVKEFENRSCQPLTPQGELTEPRRENAGKSATGHEMPRGCGDPLRKWV